MFFLLNIFLLHTLNNFLRNICTGGQSSDFIKIHIHVKSMFNDDSNYTCQ